jgi:hypothetical protein
MEWDIQFDAGFMTWFQDLEEPLRVEILGHVVLLRERGPQLGRPYVDTVEGSAYANIKELPVQFGGDPWRNPHRLRPPACRHPARRGKQAGRQAMVSEASADRR